MVDTHFLKEGFHDSLVDPMLNEHKNTSKKRVAHFVLNKKAREREKLKEELKDLKEDIRDFLDEESEAKWLCIREQGRQMLSLVPTDNPVMSQWNLQSLLPTSLSLEELQRSSYDMVRCLEVIKEGLQIYISSSKSLEDAYRSLASLSDKTAFDVAVLYQAMATLSADTSENRSYLIGELQVWANEQEKLSTGRQQNLESRLKLNEENLNCSFQHMQRKIEQLESQIGKFESRLQLVQGKNMSLEQRILSLEALMANKADVIMVKEIRWEVEAAVDKRTEAMEEQWWKNLGEVKQIFEHKLADADPMKEPPDSFQMSFKSGESEDLENLRSMVQDLEAEKDITSKTLEKLTEQLARIQFVDRVKSELELKNKLTSILEEAKKQQKDLIKISEAKVKEIELTGRKNVERINLQAKELSSKFQSKLRSLNSLNSLAQTVDTVEKILDPIKEEESCKICGGTHKRKECPLKTVFKK